MIILFDLDGTLLDWGLNYDKHLDKNPALSHIPRTALQQSFGIMDNLPPEDYQGILDIMNKESFYAELEPIPGAVQVVQETIDLGYTVFFVTSPWVGNRTCLQDKQDSVEKHFGKGSADRLILTRDKTMVHGDILFDDKPDISGALTPTWEHVYFTQPYNANRIDHRRVNSWGSWSSVVEQLNSDTHLLVG